MVKRRMSAQAHALIYELAAQAEPRLSAGQIHSEVTRRLGKRGRGNVVSLRTVQRVLSEIQPGDDAVWSIDDAEDHDAAAAVLEVIRDLSDTASRLVAIRKDQAEWIVTVRRAAPDLDSRAVFQVALIYYVARKDGRSTADVDAWLAYAPWRDRDHPSRYRQAVDRGLMAFDAARWAEGLPEWWEEGS